MPEKEPPVTQEKPKEKKGIPVLGDEEKRELLEKLPTSELLVREEIIKNELTVSEKNDQQRFVDLNGSVSLKNSISNGTLQIKEELCLIDGVINSKAKTIQDASQYNGVPPTDKDIRDLFILLRPDGKYDNLQARLYFQDYIIRQTGSFPKRGETKMPVINMDELMECIYPSIKKNDPNYKKYEQIIAVLFIKGTADETEFSGEDIGDRELEKEAKRLSSEKQVILEDILATRKSSSNNQTDVLRSMTTTDDILEIIGTNGNYERAKNILEGDAYGLTLSQEQYNSLFTSAQEVLQNADENTKRAQENQDIQVAALEKGNLVEALQQETKYQRESSQIEYYRDLRSSLSKTEGSTTNNNPPAFRNGINVNEANFSQNLEYFMNDERTNAIYPKLSDGTNIPIRKAGDDIYLVQGCQVPADEVAGLVQLNEALAEKGLRFFSTKSPLTRILSNIEQTLRGKGIRNVPHFGDLKNVSTYQDNIVDILYALIDPDPKASIKNIDERIKHSDRGFAGGIPLIAYGRQSGIVKEDSSIDINKLTEKLTTLIQSGYPFLFGGDKKERG